MSELAVGIVGVGGLGTHMGEQFEDVDGVSIAGIADVSDESRASAGDRFGLSADARYAEYGAMLDGEPLDAVVVTTPHTLHYEQVVAGLERDLHVYCEKPLVTDLDDARDLVERDAATDLVLMVGYQRHLDPAFRRGRERWAAGDREPRYMTAEVTQDLFEGAGGWYTDPELSGGGQIYATGTHLVDALLWMTGLDPVAVTATLDLHEGTPRLDKHAALTVQFANDAVAAIGISGDTARTREHVHVWDDDGALYIDGREWDQRTVTIIDAEGTEHSPHLGGPDRTKAQAFVDSIRTGSEPPATARDALRATAIKEAVYDADREARTVTVDL